MRVYISGKIGEEVTSDATRRKFARAEEMLRAKRYEVFNPCGEKWQQVVQAGARIEARVYNVEPYEYILLRDIEKMTRCDAVYFLEDWQQSPGAKAEYYFAKAARKRMFFQGRFEACEYLVKRMYAEAIAAGKPIDARGLERYKLETDYFTNHLHEVWLPIEEGKEAEP